MGHHTLRGGKQMQVTRNVFTIADLVKWLEEKSLIINRDYQRGSGLWPLNARSYFIDTILNGYPFPKITIRQTMNLKTRKSVREIIDGQQRLMTIYDFVDNNITLSSVSKLYKGNRFQDLEDEDKEKFLSYEVSVDTIIAATEEEVLETFRRMNSYTLPLNDQEKRHATYQGEFKWFVKDMIDIYVPMLETYKILTVKQISRMADADLMTELCQVLLIGVEARTASKLDNLYKEYDKRFRNKNEIENKLRTVLDYIKKELNPILSKEVMKSYSFYSLFCALVYNKWGIENVDSREIFDLDPMGNFTSNKNKAIQNIMELLMEVDLNNDTGIYGEFVKASTSTTHSYRNRIIRLKFFVAALQDEL